MVSTHQLQQIRKEKKARREKGAYQSSTFNVVGAVGPLRELLLQLSSWLAFSKPAVLSGGSRPCIGQVCWFSTPNICCECCGCTPIPAGMAESISGLPWVPAPETVRGMCWLFIIMRCCMFCVWSWLCICSWGSTAPSCGEASSGKNAVPSGNSCSGWKFSQRDGERLGEVRVTRNRSGGVAGRENCPLKGVVGRVFPRERPVPVKDSRGTPGEPWGRFGAECCPISSLDGVAAGVCGRDRSYETGGVGPPFGSPRSMSSNLRLGGRSGRLWGGGG